MGNILTTSAFPFQPPQKTIKPENDYLDTLLTGGPRISAPRPENRRIRHIAPRSLFDYFPAGFHSSGVISAPLRQHPCAARRYPGIVRYHSGNIPAPPGVIPASSGITPATSLRRPALFRYYSSFIPAPLRLQICSPLFSPLSSPPIFSGNRDCRR